MVGVKSTERIVYIRPDIVHPLKYTLQSPPNRVVLAEEGFGMPPLEYVADRAPFQHGDTVRSFHLAPRQVQLTILHNFCSREEYRLGRAELLAALRPNALQPLGSVSELAPSRQGKLLCYLAGGAKRQLDVLIDSGPGFAPPQGGWREWSYTEVLRFTAHDPTWYDPTLRTQTLSVPGADDGLIFPITFPITFAETFYNGSVTYLGDWPSYPVIHLYGPITTPTIWHDNTGLKISLNYTLAAGYYIRIDLQERVIERSDGVNLIGYLTDDSDLTEFALLPDPNVSNGINLLHVSGTETDVTTSNPILSWYDRYIGI